MQTKLIFKTETKQDSLPRCTRIQDKHMFRSCDLGFISLMVCEFQRQSGYILLYSLTFKLIRFSHYVQNVQKCSWNKIPVLKISSNSIFKSFVLWVAKILVKWFFGVIWPASVTEETQGPQNVNRWETWGFYGNIMDGQTSMLVSPKNTQISYDDNLKGVISLNHNMCMLAYVNQSIT